MLKGVARRLGSVRRNSLTVYGIAGLLAVAALLTRLALNTIIADRAPYVTFFLATAASAALGGLWPGIVTAILGVLLARFVLPAGGWAHLTDPSDPMGPIRYLVVGCFVSYLCEVLIRARERARTAEQRLRESERIYRAIGESIPFGIWICDAQGHNTYTSDGILKLTGMTQEECSEFGWGRALHPDDEKRIIPLWQKCVREQGIWDVEMRYRGVDGEYHPVLARGVPVQDDEGRILCWAGINLDISRLKVAEAELHSQAEELRRSNRDLEQFAFVASHDMQEPLRMVNIYAELLLQRIGADRSSELDTFAGFVRDGVRRMEGLVRDLLSLSRVIHTDIKRVPVDSGAALQDALDVSQIQQSRAEVEIEALPMVMAEQAHVARVFQNLISNSIKYRKAGIVPRIRVSAKLEGEEVIFRVDDNGIGFDPEYRELVFKVFTRLHGSQYEGSGMGLAICQRIVERYGGRIWVESKAGEGSSFFFTLPLAQAMEARQGG